MRDGAKLFTAVYIPKDSSQQYPVLMERTPYSVAPYGEDKYSRSLGPNRGIYRGVEGLREFVTDQWSTFEEVRLEAHEFIPRGDAVAALRDAFERCHVQ